MIYIWVRKTLDWDDEKAPLAQISGAFKPKVDLCNTTFTMSYQRFRCRLAQIADRNHAQVEGAVRARWDEIPAGAMVLPVDDDWLAPLSARVIEREVDPALLGCVWPSNNYAVRKSPGAEPILNSHMEASRWFEHELARPERHVARLDRALSLTNRNLASQTSLGQTKPTIARSALLRKYRRYRRLYRRPPPSGLDWCRPSLESMAELMADLKLQTEGG